MTRALVIVDVQRDFCEGGSLAVAGGNEVARRIADNLRGIQTMDSGFYDWVVATKDHHLSNDDNGGHFSDNPDYSDTWPAHCVQGTDGNAFHSDIEDVRGFIDEVFYKGQGRPSYSGFEGWSNQMVPLHDWLTERDVTELVIVGIATGHCVKATALDAIALGYDVRVPISLTAAVGGPEERENAILDIYAAAHKQTKVN